MRIFLYWLIFVSFLSPGTSQTLNKDSLQAIQFERRGMAFYPSQLDSALIFTFKAQELYLATKTWAGYVQTFSSISSIYYANEDFDKFKEHAFLGLAIAKKYLKSNDKVLGTVWNNFEFLLLSNW